MLTLGIETATAVCSVALVKNGKLVCEKTLFEKNIHSEKIIPLIDEILKIEKKFDRIAVSIGPGSFTGLRVGLSTAKGLAYASNNPIVPIPTLKGLAYNLVVEQLDQGAIILPLIDARRDEFYIASYKHMEAELIEISPAKAATFKDIIENIQTDKEYAIVGDGAKKFHQLMENYKIDLKNLKFYQSNVNFCSAKSIALLAENTKMEYDLNFIAKLEPIYIKDFQTLVKTQH